METHAIPDSLPKKFMTSLIAGVTLAALLLMLGNGGNVPWLPPMLIFGLCGIVLLLSLLYPFIWHYRKANSAKKYRLLYYVTRYCIAFNIAGFGFKKLFGLQFIVPAEIASLPVKEISGEWLTWYYFGYSPGFGLVIAAIQIGGACMLLCNRTVLLGGAILFSLMLNLMVVNIFYGMNAGALLQSVVLTMGLLFLILVDYQRLAKLFFNISPSYQSTSKNSMANNILRFSAILLSLLFTWYLSSLAY